MFTRLQKKPAMISCSTKDCVMREHLRVLFFFFFQAEDGIRDLTVTGVQTCALPICTFGKRPMAGVAARAGVAHLRNRPPQWGGGAAGYGKRLGAGLGIHAVKKIGRASGRGRGEISVGAGSLKKKKEKKRGVSMSVKK